MLPFVIPKNTLRNNESKNYENYILILLIFSNSYFSTMVLRDNVPLRWFMNALV